MLHAVLSLLEQTDNAACASNQHGDNTGSFRLKTDEYDGWEFFCIINEGPQNVPMSGVKKVRGLLMSAEEWRNNNGGCQTAVAYMRESCVYSA